MSEWRQVQKKPYNVGIAKAPVGTVVFNDLEQVLDKGTENERTLRSVYAKTFPQLKERPFLTALEVEAYSQTIPEAVEKLKSEAYVTGYSDVVIVGTEGEMWVSDWQKAAKTYDGYDPYTLTEEFVIAHTSPSANKVEVRLAEKGEVIKTSWGAELVAGEGDYISAYNEERTDLAVINGKVFENTYEPYGTPQTIKHPTNQVPLPRCNLYGYPAKGESLESVLGVSPKLARTSIELYTSFMADLKNFAESIGFDDVVEALDFDFKDELSDTLWRSYNASRYAYDHISASTPEELIEGACCAAVKDIIYYDTCYCTLGVKLDVISEDNYGWYLGVRIGNDLVKHRVAGDMDDKLKARLVDLLTTEIVDSLVYDGVFSDNKRNALYQPLKDHIAKNLATFDKNDIMACLYNEVEVITGTIKDSVDKFVAAYKNAEHNFPDGRD